MDEEPDRRRNRGQLNGKWVVVIIVVAGMVVAVLAGKYTRYRLPPGGPSSQPVQGEQ